MNIMSLNKFNFRNIKDECFFLVGFCVYYFAYRDHFIGIGSICLEQLVNVILLEKKIIKMSIYNMIFLNYFSRGI